MWIRDTSGTLINLDHVCTVSNWNGAILALEAIPDTDDCSPAVWTLFTGGDEECHDFMISLGKKLDVLN